MYSGPFQDETGSDGIGDAPYIIDEHNQDCYQLMKPWTPLLSDVNWDEFVNLYEIVLAAVASGLGLETELKPLTAQ